MPPRVGAQRHCPDLGLLSRHVELSALFHGKLWAYLVLSPQGVKNFEDWHGSAPILLTHKVTLYLAPPSGICQMDKRLLNLSSHYSVSQPLSSGWFGHKRCWGRSSEHPWRCSSDLVFSLSAGRGGCCPSSCLWSISHSGRNDPVKSSQQALLLKA